MLHAPGKASGSHGMAGGQAIDLASVGKPCRYPNWADAHPQNRRPDPRSDYAWPPEWQYLKRRTLSQPNWIISKCIGLAFQVIDDVLMPKPAVPRLGKTAGKDAANDKPTYVSLLGLETGQATGTGAARRMPWPALAILATKHSDSAPTGSIHCFRSF